MATEHVNDKAFRRAFWALLAVAAALRAAFFHFLPLLDDGNESYLQPAYELLHAGHYVSLATLHRLPAAPFFFAFVMAFVGERTVAVAAVQHLLGLATFALAVGAARRAWGNVGGIAAACLLVGQLQLPFLECFIISESFAHFLLALALFETALFLNERRPGTIRAASLGAVCGLAALTRGEFILLGPLTAAFVAWTQPRGPLLRQRGAAALFAAWALIVGGWAARNAMLFGYPGLTPDSITTLTDTALPFVRFDGGVEPEAKSILKEEAAKASFAFKGGNSDSGIDPRASTLERLRDEKGYDYLRAENALGRIVWETLRAHPLAYAKASLPEFAGYLKPPTWVEDAELTRTVRESSESGKPGWDFFWRLLEASRAWSWLALGASLLALPLLIWHGADARGYALLCLALYVGLLSAISLTDAIVPRLQAEFFIPLCLLGAFTAANLTRLVGRDRVSR